MGAQPPERFDPHEVVALLGAGGMGHVYRTRDPRLNRQVAIKVLARAGADPVRQRRLCGQSRARRQMAGKVVSLFNVFDELRRLAPVTRR